MSLRQKLTKPLVIEPTDAHTHTVIFLHRFPAETTEEELRGRVLAQKLTKNHKTLREQFPAVRWVFPHPKAHARHWSNLSAEDKAELGMGAGRGGLPYITQVILQEARHAGGLDGIVLGGQGETAEAAHEAMSSFPEPSKAQKAGPEAMAGFVRENFRPDWTGVDQLRLAGFVGMHAQGGQVTRDAKDFGIASKVEGARGVNTTIVANTPHKFIQGGYKVQTTTWDGRRIDDFARFLSEIGATRVQEDTKKNGGGGGGIEKLTPRDRSGGGGQKKEANPKEELNDVQKHALLVMREKEATEQTRALILRRIEADKVERKIRQERQRQARLAREGKLDLDSQSSSADSQPDHDAPKDGTGSSMKYGDTVSPAKETGG